MSYAIYTLHFTTPVHFGNAELGGKLEQVSLEYTSDSLFSALCWELHQLGELDYLHEFCEKIMQGSISFSDLLPYIEDTDNDIYKLYIPKPICIIEPTGHVEEDFSLQDARRVATERKQQKKMKYLRTSEVDAYMTALRNGTAYTSPMELGEQELVEQVNCRGEEPLPYYVGTYTFRQDAGLYVLVKYDDNTDFDMLLQVFELLGMTGIGGKRSSGLGKFTVEDTIFLEDEMGIFGDVETGIRGDDGTLYTMLEQTTSPLQMSLSTIIPNAEELSIVANGQYLLRRRSGFTLDHGTLRKRNSVYAIQAGSCFSTRLEGSIVVLDDRVEPPVWRNGKGLFVGLPI